MNAFSALVLAAVQAAPAPPTLVDPAPVSVILPRPAAVCCRLARLTPVSLRIDQAIDSDKAQVGQSFAIRLAEPIDLGAGLIIPVGTAGMGEVVHAAKSRAMGKPGELLLAARYLDWNGTRIPLRSFKFGKMRGDDNADTAAVVGIVVSGLIAPFITGGEVRIPSGADAWAKVATNIDFPAPAASTGTTPAPTATSTTSPTGGNIQ